LSSISQRKSNPVFINNLSSLTDSQGIYFLYKNRELVYIGQALNIRRRIFQHVKAGEKMFNCVRIKVTNLSKNSLDMLEQMELNLFLKEKGKLPIYNKIMIIKGA